MTRFKKLPPFEVVDYFMHYEPETGIATWKFDATRYIKAGKQIGAINGDGYYNVKFFKQCYCLHRICWLLHYKQDPGSMVIDHIDGNKINNKIQNLRLATQQQNTFNRSLHSNNNTGFTGVNWSKQKKCYVARVRKNRKIVYIGHFASLQDAVNARNNAAKNIFGEFARINHL